MKRTLCILTFCLFVKLSFSQFCLGFTEREVILHAEKIEAVKIRKQYNATGKLQIIWEKPELRTDYAAMFSGIYVSDFFLIPNDEEMAKIWLDVMNETYTKIDTGYWKGYNRGVPIEIVFSRFPEGNYYFRFNLAD